MLLLLEDNRLPECQDAMDWLVISGPEKDVLYSELVRTGHISSVRELVESTPTEEYQRLAGRWPRSMVARRWVRELANTFAKPARNARRVVELIQSIAPSQDAIRQALVMAALGGHTQENLEHILCTLASAKPSSSKKGRRLRS